MHAGLLVFLRHAGLHAGFLAFLQLRQSRLLVMSRRLLVFIQVAGWGCLNVAALLLVEVGLEHWAAAPPCCVGSAAMGTAPLSALAVRRRVLLGALETAMLLRAAPLRRMPILGAVSA